MGNYTLLSTDRRRGRNISCFIILVFAVHLALMAGYAGTAEAAAPTAPTNLAAAMASSRQINLTWTDNATTETNYYVERSPNGTSSWTVVATLGANITSYQNTGLTQNTRYYYRVRCKAGSTYSSYSNTANATTAVLAAPTSLTSTVASATQITLNWTDNTAYETQYSIERSPNGTSSWTVRGTVATNVTTTINSGLAAGTAYYYRVRAYDGTNYSVYSNTANQTIRTITASAGANGTIAPSGTVGVANGGTQTFTMTPNGGYKIATVTVNGGAVATNPTYTFTNVTSNQTISATFSVNTYTISASAGPNGTITPSGAVAVNGGATQAFTMTPNSGYKIDSVTVDGGAVATNPTYTFTNVTAPHTISATFSANTVTITASAGPNGTIAPSGAVAVTLNTNQTFTITPNANYRISDVVVDGASVGTPAVYTFPSVIATHSIVASFVINTFTINATAGANGSISPSGAVSVVSGATPTFTATPNAGYRILDIQVDGLSVGSAPTYTFSPVTANHTISATFSANTVTITAIAGPNGTITPAGSVAVTLNTNQTFSITPNPNYRISDVLVDLVSVGTPSLYTFPTVSAPHTISATFSVQTYTITATAGSGGTVTPSGGIAVPKGTDHTVAITPNTGFWITDVLVDGQSVGPVTSYLFSNVTATHTISASFADRTIVAGGRMSVNTTWTKARSPYIVNTTIQTYGTTTMPVTLTIEPGVTVRFVNSAGLQIGYSAGQEQGALIAQGTLAEPVTFTRDGTNTWGGITFYNGTVDGTTIIENTYIEFSATIVMFNASPTIKNSTLSNMNVLAMDLYSSSAVIENVAITNSALASIRLDTSSPIITGGMLANTSPSGYGILGLSSSSPVISNCTITTSQNASYYGIKLPATTSGFSIMNSTVSNGLFVGSVGITPTITGNTFSNADSSPLHAGANIIGQILDNNTFTGMTPAGRIEVVGETINRDTRWKQWPAPYVVTAGTVNVYKDTTTAATLTIDPGVTVKFDQGGMQIGSGTVKGILNAKGTAANKIIFTTIQTTPTIKYWSGITFSGDAASSSTIEHVIIEYAGVGGATTGNITLSSSSPVIRNSIIRNSSQSGVYAGSAQNWPVIIDSEITGNKWGVYSSASNPYITNTRITGNTTAGVWNTATTMDVDARDNWWGVATGPTHTGNSLGTGDKISDRVLYNPWLGQVPGTTLSITEAKVLPASMNPDGDYVTFSAKISSSATWTIAITDANSATVKTFSGTGTTINQKWYGDDSQSIKVSDGVYYYKVDAADAGGNSASSPQGLIMVSRQIPVAIMDPPVDNQMFPCGSAINITGTVADSTDFKNYLLDYGAGENPTAWTNLKTSTTATTNGLLYAWNTSALTGYTYTVRLTVNDNAGNMATETSRVRFLCIQNATASEGYISPNGDGVKDSTVISAAFTQPSDWTITIRNASATVVRTISDTGPSVSQLWDGKDSGGLVVSDGTYTYQIDATGSGTSTAAAPKTGTIVVAAMVANVGISSNTINTQAGESSTVFFTINSQATVTFSMIPEKQGPTGTPVYQTGKVCAGGACSFTWDGKDNTGKVVPDEAYLFVLTVSDATHSGGYSPVAPTGTGTVACSQSTGLDPEKNIPLTVTYTPAQPSRVNVVIDWGSQNFKIADAVPATPESHAFDWEGRNPGNKLLDEGAKASCSVASLLRENHIITTGDAVRVSEVKTDPYRMHLSYGQFTKISYTLSRDAIVTLTLTSPSGAVITLFNDQAQAAGAQEYTWNGLDLADTTGKNMLVTEEGDFMVSVQAVNPQTGSSSTTKANVRIGF